MQGALPLPQLSEHIPRRDVDALSFLSKWGKARWQTSPPTWTPPPSPNAIANELAGLRFREVAGLRFGWKGPGEWTRAILRRRRSVGKLALTLHGYPRDGNGSWETLSGGHLGLEVWQAWWCVRSLRHHGFSSGQGRAVSWAAKRCLALVGMRGMEESPTIDPPCHLQLPGRGYKTSEHSSKPGVD